LSHFHSPALPPLLRPELDSVVVAAVAAPASAYPEGPHALSLGAAVVVEGYGVSGCNVHNAFGLCADEYYVATFLAGEILDVIV